MHSVFVFFILIFLALPGFSQQMCSSVFVQAKEVFQSHHLIEVSSRKESLGQEVLLVQRKTEIQKRLFRKEKEVIKDWGDFNINPDKPGDLRWGVEHLGPAMRKLLGLKTLDHQGNEVPAMGDDVSYVQVPSVATVLHSFKLLEAKMKETNPEFQWIGFFETNSQILSGKMYLEKIVNEGTMPISRQGHLFEHDLNYHVYSSFVVPPQFVKALRSRMDVFLGFVRFLEALPPTKENIEIQKVVRDKMFEEVVSRVDSATGNFFKTVIRDSDKSLQHTMTEVYDSLDVAFLERLTPRDYFIELTSHRQWGVSLKKVAEDYAQTLPESTRQQDLPDFYFKNPAEFYNQANAQFKALEKAAVEVLSDGPRFP